MKRTYFHPDDITYTHAQLMFLLYHLHTLEAGCYPGIENEVVMSGGQLDPSGGGCRGSVVPYKPNGDALRMANELNARLKLCGRDGQIVRMRFADHLSVKQVCELMHLERRWVFHCSQQCLKFMAGRSRPRQPYRQECIPASFCQS